MPHHTTTGYASVDTGCRALYRVGLVTPGRRYLLWRSRVKRRYNGGGGGNGQNAVWTSRVTKQGQERPEWGALERFAPVRIRGWIQDLLEEEVTELLGMGRSERRPSVDAPAGYRDGRGKTRRLSMMAGTMEVRRPRVRGLEQRFESRILPLFVRRTREVAEILPRLYLHGLAQGDFELALRGLPREGAPLSASSLERLRGKWQSEYEQWKSHPSVPTYVRHRPPSSLV